MVEDELMAAIALQELEGIGPILARRLLEHFGSFSEVTKASFKDLMEVQIIGSEKARRIKSGLCLKRAEEELFVMEKLGIYAVGIDDPRFPSRLKQCPDAPVVLFMKGELDLNYPKVISVVGMRKVSKYGEEMTRRLISDLRKSHPLVLSGLAYGVDIIAHRQALKEDLPTAAVFAHGLDRVYPSAHRRTAMEILDNGGLWVSEFISGTNPDRENFPKRNRVIAGLSDATLVIESGLKGGSMITSSLAFGYSREVFAVPGEVGNLGTQGCHSLIKDQKASLVENGDDILFAMGWGNDNKIPRQQLLFDDLDEDEKTIAETLRLEDLHIDILALRTQIPIARLSGLLLQMELKNLVRTSPGKKFGLVK